MLVGFGDGVPAVSEPSCVAADASGVLYDVGGPGGDRGAKLAASVVTVDAGAQLVARSQILFVGWADAEAGDAERRGRSLEDRQRLADREAEFRVERKRAVVVGRLNEPDAHRAAVALAA